MQLPDEFQKAIDKVRNNTKALRVSATIIDALLELDHEIVGRDILYMCRNRMVDESNNVYNCLTAIEQGDKGKEVVNSLLKADHALRVYCEMASILLRPIPTVESLLKDVTPEELFGNLFKR